MNKAKQKIGIMGGTFNPIHFGHLQQALDFKEAENLDEVWLVPNRRSPLRQGEPLASGADRLSMVEAAVGPVEGLKACPVELEREGLSYTVETLEYLHASYPEVSWSFLIGADSLKTFHHWFRVDALVQLADVVVVQRPGTDLHAERMELANRAPSIAAALRVLARSRHIDLSSSEIRERVRRRREIRFMVPEKVHRHIESRGLYRS